MKKLAQFIASNIVDNPDKLKISQSLDEQSNTLIINIKASEEDVGKIIGKKGKIIQAIRNLIRVKAIKEGKRVILNVD